MFSRFIPVLFRGLIAVLLMAILLTGWFVINTVLQKPETPRTAAERAIMDGEESVKADPKSVDARLSLAAAYAGAGRHGSAISELKAAVRIDPRNTQAHYMMGAIFREQGKIDDAILTLEKAAKFPGELGDVYNNIYYELGMAYKEKKDYKKAILAFTEAQKYGIPLYLLKDLAECYEKTGQIQQAQLAYLNILERDVDNAEAIKELKRLKVDQKVIDEVRLAGRGQHTGGTTGTANTGKPATTSKN